MANHLPIIKEAIRRSLASGTLAVNQPLNVAQTEGLEGYGRFLHEASEETDLRRAYADMATGTGKTGLFSTIARHAHHIAREQGVVENFKTIIVEPTVPLLKQTRAQLQFIAPELEQAIGVFGGGAKDLSKPFTIVTYDAWLDLLESGKLHEGAIGFHISDEAHHGLSPRRQALINEKLANTIHFGVTATAQYDLEKSLERTHQNLVYKIDLKDSVERGLLTDYIHVQYAVMRLLPEDLNRPGLELENGDFTFLKRQEWARLIERAYATMTDGISGQELSNKIGTIFAADTRHADSIAALLNKNPILAAKAKASGFKSVAMSIHSMGGHSDKAQEEMLENFKAGQYMVAVGDKKFKAGFDYSRVKFIASYPGNSAVDTVQEIGRATRRYIDPITGQLQGTVIFEAVPYIGSADHIKDERARQEALARVVTAKDVLGRTLVLSPNHDPIKTKPITPGHKKASDTQEGTSQGKKVTLSPGCTAQVYLTGEETLTIARQIDIAREEILATSENRIVIDLAALKAKLNAKGGISYRRLFKEVAEYLAKRDMPNPGLTQSTLHHILQGKIKSIEETRWDLLNKVIENLPDEDIPSRGIQVGALPRIKVTEEMRIAFKDKLAKRGGFGPKPLYKIIAAYVEKEKISDPSLTRSILVNVYYGYTDTILENHWQTINKAIEALPIIDPSARYVASSDSEISGEISRNFQISAGELTELTASARKKGYGGRNLFDAIQNHLQNRQKPLLRLDRDEFKRIFYGDRKTVEPSEWTLIRNTIDDLGENVSPRVSATKSPVTQEMLTDLQRRITATGLGYKNLLREVAVYTEKHDLSDADITQAVIRYAIAGGKRINGHRGKRINAAQFKLLSEVVDNILEPKAVIAPPNISRETSHLAGAAKPRAPERTEDQKIAALFARFSDGLVERITDAVVKRLSGPPADVPALKTDRIEKTVRSTIEEITAPGKNRLRDAERRVEDKTPAKVNKVQATAAAAELTVPGIGQTLLRSVLRVLDVSVDQLEEKMEIHKGTYGVIAQVIAGWVNEPQEVKRGRNQVIERFYLEAKPLIEQMVQEGRNIQEIADELNNAGLQSFEWQPNLLLRGAILANGILPLNLFTSAPSIGSQDKTAFRIALQKLDRLAR